MNASVAGKESGIGSLTKAADPRARAFGGEEAQSLAGDDWPQPWTLISNIRPNNRKRLRTALVKETRIDVNIWGVQIPLHRF